MVTPNTPPPPRPSTNPSVRVSNTFKMDRLHGMVVTSHGRHHPTDLPRDLYTAFLADAVKLAEDMLAANPDHW